jgi:hypothetical protein
LYGVGCRNKEEFEIAINKEWEFLIDETMHVITFKQTVFTGKRYFEIDGNPVKIPRFNCLHSYMSVEYPITVAGHHGLFVIKNNANFDIVLDGKFITTGKDYIPSIPLPKWSWIFIVACLAIVMLAMGGAIPAVLTVFGVVGCTRIVRLSKMSTRVKVLLCTLVTGACWGTFILTVIIMAQL